MIPVKLLHGERLMRLFLAVPVAGNDLFPQVSRALVYTLAVSIFHDKFFHAW